MGAGKTEPLRAGTVVPTFRGIYLERFLHLAEGISELGSLRQRDAVMRELGWCDERPAQTLDQQRYRGMLLVLRDLLAQGWRLRYAQRSIFLSRPDYVHGTNIQLDPLVVKAQIRDALSTERLAKLRSPSTTRFIRSLEQPPPNRRPIADLIADGSELAAAFRTIAENPSLADLRKIISPYLQFVERDERDRYSGHRLIDIWRYFRYLWAIPYLATPGRNLFYLVRDAARAHHPIIGISALGNSVVQLADRDRLIGWSIEGFERRLEASRQDGTLCEFANRLAARLSRAIEAELGHVNAKGLANRREMERPTDAVIERLQTAAKESEHERREFLQQSAENGRLLKRQENGRAFKKDSQSALYTRKRAQVLADLLFAKRQFHRCGLAVHPVEALEAMLLSDGGRKAIRTALYSNKKSKIGSNMMDIIVCGAIPPYAELLGGKLVAMLMASPQVIEDYRTRYADQPSEIASRVAGRPIARSADLVFLGTTTLYHVGSSQYERIKIPAPGGAILRYERLGHTEGFGSALLSGQTTIFLRELVVRAEGMRRVNNVFGEGISPRLRQIRDGLGEVGIPQNVVLKHSCPRIIYGLSLAANAFPYLRGEEDAPQYYFSLIDSYQQTAAIANFWLQRWLWPRFHRSESLRKTEMFCKRDILLSNELNTSLQEYALADRKEPSNVGSD